MRSEGVGAAPPEMRSEGVGVAPPEMHSEGAGDDAVIAGDVAACGAATGTARRGSTAMAAEDAGVSAEAACVAADAVATSGTTREVVSRGATAGISAVGTTAASGVCLDSRALKAST